MPVLVLFPQQRLVVAPVVVSGLFGLLVVEQALSRGAGEGWLEKRLAHPVNHLSFGAWLLWV